MCGYSFRLRRLLLALVIAGIAITPSFSSEPKGVSYMLLEGSTLTDECIICGRPTLIMPMRGTFQLAFREENPLFTTYDVQELAFHAPTGTSTYKVSGAGTYEIGGEVALVQRMQLNVQINDRKGVELKNDYVPIQRFWPMIEIDIREPDDPPDPLQVFYMHIVAAPVREIWFSTGVGLTSGSLNQRVSAGDLLSHTGRIVKTNQELVGRLGIMPMVPDLGLDAFDVAPGGEALFSIEENIFSETLGPLQHGDILSDKGRIVRRNQDLISPFGPMLPIPHVGLDAVQMMKDGEILFSIEGDVFSEKLGVCLGRGDIPSEKGTVFRTNKELLAKLEPSNLQGDAGLDALHVWPNGEIWFSTEISFESKKFGHVGQGDLLSDGGWIIFRNLDILQPFAPLEDLADFDFDALFLVTDDEGANRPLTQAQIVVDAESGDVSIEWLSDSKVFQVERADEPGGPYFPSGFIFPGTDFLDPAAALGKTRSFYRIREW